MAKWYQYDIRPESPGIAENTWAIPTASETAPPGLPAITSLTSDDKESKFVWVNPNAFNCGNI